MTIFEKLVLRGIRLIIWGIIEGFSNVDIEDDKENFIVESELYLKEVADVTGGDSCKKRG